MKIKHKLKQILIQSKLWGFFQPIYDVIYGKLVYLSPRYRKRQKRLLNFYSQFIKKGDLCFDIGAYMGSRIEMFLKLGARVVAVEPQERCTKYLEKRFGKNPNLILIKKGLADREGELTFYICEEANSVSTFSEKWQRGRFSDYQWNVNKIVPVTTLDNLIKEFGIPVFCKIDVEGFEHQVLKGLSQPIKYLSFEFTKEFFEEMKLSLNYLLSFGPTLFNCDFYESMEFIFPKWLSAKELIEKIESIDDNLLGGDIYVKFLEK